MLNIRKKGIDVVLSSLKDRRLLYQGQLMISKEDAEVILWLLEKGWFTEKQLRDALHEGICICGESSFREHMERGEKPDLTYSPHALGYAIIHDKISKKDAQRIKFDHGETVEQYKEMASGLLERVFTQIEQIATAPEKVYPPHSSDCCCCDD